MPAVDNKERIGKIKIAFIVISALVVPLVVLLFLDSTDQVVKDVLVGIIALLLSINIFMLMLKLNYFFVEVKNNKITVRYYGAYPFFRKYKAFEIPVRAYVGFSVKTGMFGLSKGVIFHAKNKQKAISLAPVSASAFSKEDMQKLSDMLKRHAVGKN